VGEQIVTDLVRIPRGAEDLFRVRLEHLDPVLDIGGMMAGVVVDTELVSDLERGDLGA